MQCDTTLWAFLLNTALCNFNNLLQEIACSLAGNIINIQILHLKQYNDVAVSAQYNFINLLQEAACPLAGNVINIQIENLKLYKYNLVIEVRHTGPN